TRARVPCRLTLTPAAPAPASSVAMTWGGLDLRSITESRLSGACLVRSLGSIFMAEVTRARPSSGVMATLRGGPTTLAGTGISARTLGGDAPRSMMVMVSGAGFCTTVATPLTRASLLSFADTAICARAGVAAAIADDSAATARTRTADLRITSRRVIGDLLVQVKGAPADSAVPRHGRAGAGRRPARSTRDQPA